MVAKSNVTLMMKITEELFTSRTLILLLVFYITIHFLKKAQRKKLNEPPLVRYKYPIIGHSWEYSRDVNGFIAKCRAEYGDIFRVYVYGRVMTVVGKEHAHEVFNSNICSFNEGFLEMIPLFEILGLGSKFEAVTADLVRKTFLENVDVYSSRFQSVLHENVEEIFGDLKSKQIASPLEFVQGIIAKTMARVLLGEEAEKIPELINTLFDIAIGETFQIPNTLSYIHPYLHKLFILFLVRLGGNTPKKNIDKLVRIIKPIIDERILKKKKLGSMWKEPIDLLNGLINDKRIDQSNVDYRWIAAHIKLMVFIAVHTTSTIGAKCLIDYAFNSRNPQELHEEQLKANPENKKFITNEEANKMEKMDSFIKESLRMSDVVAGLHHKITEPVFRFSNGYEVPSDNLIIIDKSSIHLNPKYTYGNPLEFDGNRYVGKDSPSTKIGRSYIGFGLGRHACPGRFFAVFEIKSLMGYLIRNFEIKPAGKTRTKDMYVAGFVFLSGQLIFERRNKK